MSIEIEAKLKVDSLEEVEKALLRIGAQPMGKVFQTDYYFDDARRSLARSDKALRLRDEKSSAGQVIVFTYKGPRQKNRYKRRQEIQLRVDNADAAAEILIALGYAATLVFVKRRSLWKFGGCEIALDELPHLGCFVEIEGAEEREIANVQARLNLADKTHISESYAALMRNYCEQNGIKQSKIVFE